MGCGKATPWPDGDAIIEAVMDANVVGIEISEATIASQP